MNIEQMLKELKRSKLYERSTDEQRKKKKISKKIWRKLSNAKIQRRGN